MKTNTLVETKNIIRLAVVTAGVLLIPLIAMQFTSDVDWNSFDFLIMGSLIFGTGLVYEILSKLVSKQYRLLVGIVLAVILFLTWAELAVGVFGTPFAGN